MKNNSKAFRVWFAAVMIIAAVLCCTGAGAETAKDITKQCRFSAGSGRTGTHAFSRCTDRDYQTYWRTSNGDKCYVEVTVPAGQTASGVMAQFYEETGTKINEISETYQKEVDRRGYPKKKTVRAKMEAVKHYIELLEQQLIDPRLNQNIDTLKINKKIELWKQQYEGLGYLLKKI